MKWKNPPKIADIKNDVTNAESYQKLHLSYINEWLDYYHIRGKVKFKKKKGRSAITPKLIRKQAEWRISSMSDPFLSTEDLYDGAPRTWEDVKNTKLNTQILNYQFNYQLDKVRLINTVIRKLVTEGTVVLWTGWNFQEVNTPIDMKKMKRIHILAQQNPEILTTLSEEDEKQFLMYTNGETVLNEVVKNQPEVSVIPLQNILFDPTAYGNMEKASFCVYTYEASMAELKAKGEYKNLDKLPLVNNDAETPDSTEIMYDEDGMAVISDFIFKDKARKKYKVNEYWGNWDIHGTGTTEPVVITYVDNVIISMKENPYPDKKLPFTVIQYLPVPNSFYGEPDTVLLKDNQDILGAVTRGIIDIMGRSANGQRGFPTDTFDAPNRKKFENQEDYEYNPNIDPEAIITHKYPEIPNSAPYMIDLMNHEAEALTGVKAFSKGITGGSLGRTARGVQSVMDATAKRELDILRRIAEGLKEIGYKIIAMNAAWLDPGTMFRITNEEFVEVKKSLKANMDLKLTISTHEVDQQKVENLSFMLQTLGNSIPFDMTKMLLANIASTKNMPDLAKQIEEYTPEPDPVEEQMKQLELQKVQVEIAKNQALAKEYEAQSQLAMAKLQEQLGRSELNKAKAKEAEAKADLLDLDYVEQETGTKHERDRDLEDHKTKSKILHERIRRS